VGVITEMEEEVVANLQINAEKKKVTVIKMKTALATLNAVPTIVTLH
jgi:hypothetical protein